MIGVWRSSVARRVRDAEVVGSNPATPTNKNDPSYGPFLFWQNFAHKGYLHKAPYE